MRRAAAVVVLTVMIMAGGAARTVSAVDDSTAPFSVATHTTSFGQAPVFMPLPAPGQKQQVVFGQDYKKGLKNQVYIWNYDGTGTPRCLTCTGPQSNVDNVNGVPAVQPGGLWILFHSWRGHNITIGSPGYGGMGSSLWVMHPDGSAQTQLTDVQTKNFAGEGFDDYHAYWSPDGRQIEYAHLNWNFVNAGGRGEWDVRVADFVVDSSGKPHLSNIRVVRPANGHWYETQWWNPDPANPGFLYTESYPKAGTDSGAVIPQLFYCRLVPARDGTPEGACDVTRLSDDPAWDEQAIFTPDGTNVIFMSSRDHPGFFNTWATETRTAGVPADDDYLLILPIFEAGFLQPVGQEATDLYEVNLTTRAVRRLTTDGDAGWITPEFTWDPTNQCLVWTENRFPDGYRYMLPPNLRDYLHQVQALAQHPPKLNQIIDINQNGVGVAPLPVQQRTQIGTFAPTTAPSCAP